MTTELAIVPAFDGKFTVNGFTFSEIGLETANENATVEQLCDMIQTFDRIQRASRTCLGDLINFGQDKYPHLYEEFQRRTGYSIQSLYNCASVMRRVPTSNRHPKLLYSDYAAVARLEPEQQTSLLEKRLRGEIKTSRLLDIESQRVHFGNAFNGGPEYRTECPACGVTLITRNEVEWIGVEE